ncbi:MAG: hypothetical protein EOO62_06500 [Hymenobacter sp.]|nr:MAG: hypothetical protein EOO62_06500 [Hymenobacter sp.]
MPAPSSFREILADVGRAICLEMVRLLDNGPYGGLRKNSALRKQLLSAGAVQVAQQRGAGGRFGSYGLTIVAQDYLQWLDSGRKPGGKKVPISALIQFVKNRQLNRGKNGRFTGEASINAIAWAIQTSIYKHGIKGRHFIDPAWALGAEVLDKLLDESALSIMSRDLDQQFAYKKTA